MAILVLLVLLGSVAVLATWRTQEDRTMSDSLGHRSAAATAVEKARAESLRSTTLITAAVFAEDATPFVDSWRQANAERDKQLSQARLALTDLGDTDALAALNSYLEQTGQTAGRVEAILDFAVTADVSTRIDLGRQQFPLLWDETRAQLADLDELANDQEAKLAAERAARDSSAETTLVLILGLSAFAFLGGTVALSGLFMSVVRPLAALRTSARAVAAGDLEARATVAGPEEVASLARDFNEMVAQRGRAEEALRESETRFRQIFESFQDMYFRTDAQGIIAEISPSVERWGYSREALIGTQVLEIYEDPEERSGLLKKLMEQGEVTDYEIRLKDADGHPHADSLSCHILRDPDGTFIGTEGIIRDITERKQAQEALQKSEHDLKERAKELNCLYGISNLVHRPDISLEETLQGTVDLIPSGWQYPEITCARIALPGQEFRTENFRETAWRQTSDIIVNGERTGAVEVCYLEEKPEADEGPFLTEERGLVDAIAERLGRVIERRQAEEALRESEARYKALFAGAPEGMLVADPETKQFRHANSAMCRMFGYTEEEFLRLGVADVHPKESLSYVLAEFEAQAQGEKLLAADIPCQRKDGSLFYADVNAIMVVLDGHKCIVGFFTDVTERRQAAEALRESEEKYRSIFESIQDMYFRTDAQGIITEISPSVERWGYSREALIGTQVLEIYEDPEERSGLLKKLMEQGEVTDYEIRLKDADGHPHADSLSCHILRDPDGTFIGTEGIIRDISERKRAEQALRDSEEALHEQARRDPLTGVLNHGAIVDEMRGLISTGTGEHGAPWAVAMIDVDRLKVANDAYGHQVGDAVLVAVAAALSRSGALVGRYGGDEFVAILPAADKNAAERYRKDATDALARATITDPQTGATMHAEASIGLAIYPEDGSTIADLIKVSDNAMYAAKRQRPFRRPSPHKRPSARKAA